MQLVVLAEDFYPSVSGGAHEQWRFCQLSATGHDVTVFTPRKAGTDRRSVVDGVEIRRPFPASPEGVPATGLLGLFFRLGFSVALFWYVCWWWLTHEPDAVYSGSNALHWVGTALGRLTGRPVVSYIGFTPSLRPADQPAAKLWLERCNFRYGLGDRVFCRVPSVRTLVASLSNRPVDIVHGILNTDRLREVVEQTEGEAIRAAYAAPDETVLAYVGRLSEEKNPTGAVAALAALPERYRLVVVGDGPERGAVEEAIVSHGVADQVTLVGQTAHEAALELLLAADGLMLPSHVEAYPTVAFEALALGCHVFATPVGILTETDHERLHVRSLEEFAATITATDFDGTTTADTETLDAYGMERFAERLLGALTELVGGDAGGR